MSRRTAGAGIVSFALGLAALLLSFSGTVQAQPLDSNPGDQNRVVEGPDPMSSVRTRLDVGILELNLLGISGRVLTYHWEHVRFTALDAGISWGVLGGNSHIGSTVAAGWRMRGDRRNAHWFLTGLWSARTWSNHPYVPVLFSTSPFSRTRGLFMPFGYEYTRHFGPETRLVWGIRTTLALGIATKTESTDFRWLRTLQGDGSYGSDWFWNLGVFIGI